MPPCDQTACTKLPLRIALVMHTPARSSNKAMQRVLWGAACQVHATHEVQRYPHTNRGARTEIPRGGIALRGQQSVHCRFFKFELLSISSSRKLTLHQGSCGCLPRSASFLSLLARMTSDATERCAGAITRQTNSRPIACIATFSV